MRAVSILASIIVGGILTGCGGGDEGSSTPPAPPAGPGVGGTGTATTPAAGGPSMDLAEIAKKMNVPYSKPLAGVEVKPTMDPAGAELRLLADNKGFTSRRDPFALLPVEKAFENAQRREKLFSEGISFTNFFEMPEEKPSEEDTMEPPPNNWRLAGIFQGNGISAIMTNGSYPALMIKPGTSIPGSEWYVVSIDSEKAVLRRRNNKRPREWVVRLQGAFDLGGAGGGDGGGNPGGPGGGNPGRPGGRGDDRDGDGGGIPGSAGK